MVKYINDKLGDEVTELRLFSDCCGGQNRNRYVMAGLLYAIQDSNSDLQTRTLNYLEPVHTEMEVGSMHSAIDRGRTKQKVTLRHLNRNMDRDWLLQVYSVIGWENIMAKSRRTPGKRPYEVVRMSFDNCLLRLQGIGRKNRFESEAGHGMTIRAMKFEKGNVREVMFKTDHEGEWRTLKGKTAKTNRENTHNETL